jgi:hypothetical protein
MALLGAATSTKVMINVCCLLFNKDCCHFSPGRRGGRHKPKKKAKTKKLLYPELIGEIRENQ